MIASEEVIKKVNNINEKLAIENDAEAIAKKRTSEYIDKEIKAQKHARDYYLQQNHKFLDLYLRARYSTKFWELVRQFKNGKNN